MSAVRMDWMLVRPVIISSLDLAKASISLMPSEATTWLISTDRSSSPARTSHRSRSLISASFIPVPPGSPLLSVHQEFMNGRRGDPSIAHGADDRRRAPDDTPAGPHVGTCCPARLGVGDCL